MPDKGILPCVDKSYRSLGRLRKQRQVQLYRYVLFATKPTANHGTQNTHFVMRHAKGVGDKAKMFDDLGRHSYVDDPVFINPCQADFGFQKGMLNKLGLECVLDDVVGFGEALFDIAFTDIVLPHNVVWFRHDRCV